MALGQLGLHTIRRRAPARIPASACTALSSAHVQVSDFGKGRASTAGAASTAAPPIALHAAKQGKLRLCLLGILLDGAKLKPKV